MTVVAHRGLPGRYPENTISACLAAVRAGARWVEIDVQIGIGGVPVLKHDFDAPDGPTLKRFATWMTRHPQVKAFVEVKGESIAAHGRQEVLDKVLEAMKVLPPDRWVLLSMDYALLALAHKKMKRLGQVVFNTKPETLAAAELLGVEWLFINQIFYPEGPLPGPFTWVVYEIQTEEQRRIAALKGATWIETMHCDKFL